MDNDYTEELDAIDIMWLNDPCELEQLQNIVDPLGRHDRIVFNCGNWRN